MKFRNQARLVYAQVMLNKFLDITVNVEQLCDHETVLYGLVLFNRKIIGLFSTNYQYVSNE